VILLIQLMIAARGKAAPAGKAQHKLLLLSLTKTATAAHLGGTVVLIVWIRWIQNAAEVQIMEEV
jgi:hypothetical protein